MRYKILVPLLLTIGVALVVGSPGHTDIGGYGEAGFVFQATAGIVILSVAAWLASRWLDTEEAAPWPECYRDIVHGYPVTVHVIRNIRGQVSGHVAEDSAGRIRFVRLNSDHDWISAGES